MLWYSLRSSIAPALELLLVGQTDGSGMLLQMARALSPTLNSCVKRASIIID